MIRFNLPSFSAPGVSTASRPAFAGVSHRASDQPVLTFSGAAYLNAPASEHPAMPVAARESGEAVDASLGNLLSRNRKQELGPVFKRQHIRSVSDLRRSIARMHDSAVNDLTTIADSFRSGERLLLALAKDIYQGLQRHSSPHSTQRELLRRKLDWVNSAMALEDKLLTTLNDGNSGPRHKAGVALFVLPKVKRLGHLGLQAQAFLMLGGARNETLHYRQAIAIAQETGDSTLESIGHLLLGHHHRRNGKMALAGEAYQRALDLNPPDALRKQVEDARRNFEATGSHAQPSEPSKQPRWHDTRKHAAAAAE